MPIFKGTYFVQTFILKDDTGTPIDITDWQFAADFRRQVSDVTPVLELTTLASTIVVTDAVNGTFEMRVTADLTDTLPVTNLFFDVMRTDAEPGPRFLFSGRIPVRQPVTRDD